MTPEEGAVRVGVVLGEKVSERALGRDLPEITKSLITEARPYAQGRGIRFPVHTVGDVKQVKKLIEMKMSLWSGQIIAISINVSENWHILS